MKPEYPTGRIWRRRHLCNSIHGWNEQRSSRFSLYVRCVQSLGELVFLSPPLSLSLSQQQLAVITWSMMLGGRGRPSVTIRTGNWWKRQNIKTRDNRGKKKFSFLMNEDRKQSSPGFVPVLADGFPTNRQHKGGHTAFIIGQEHLVSAGIDSSSLAWDNCSALKRNWRYSWVSASRRSTETSIVFIYFWIAATAVTQGGAGWSW